MAAACASSCLRETGEPMIVLQCRRGRDDEYRGGGTGLEGRETRETGKKREEVTATG